MCTTALLIGAALSAGSMVANSIAQDNVQSARNAAIRAENARQDRLDRQAREITTKDREAFDDFKGKQDEKAADLGAYYADASDTVNEGPALPAARGDIIVQADKKAKGKADAFNLQQSNALGNLRSFGDVMGEINRMQGRDAAKIGQLGSFKQGSANVLPLELDAANRAGGLPAMLGDLLGFGGSVAIGQGLRADQGIFGDDGILGSLFAANPYTGMQPGLSYNPAMFGG
jgi:hypothetical protein